MVIFRGEERSARGPGRLILEFLILVVGFFVSLQVNEWQNDREDRELELQYLSRLEKDFEKSSAALGQNIDRMRVSIDKMEAGLTILSNEQRSEEDYQTVFDALRSSSMMGAFEVYFGTFEELKDTGNMRLIQSTPLRESLGNLWQEYLQINKISQIRNMLRGHTFPVMTSYVRPQQGNQLTFDAERVESDPQELYVAMSIIRTNLTYDLADTERLLGLVDAASMVIQQELSGRSPN